MIWGCLSFNGIGTLTDVKGNINSQIYIDVLENNLWPVIARYIADSEYVFQDNAPVHRVRITENYKQENNIQYVANSIGACIKNPYIINQNHIFSKNYYKVISG